MSTTDELKKSFVDEFKKIEEESGTKSRIDIDPAGIFLLIWAAGVLFLNLFIFEVYPLGGTVSKVLAVVVLLALALKEGRQISP